MKKHPILKYILILIVSGACGALVSYLIASREEQVVQAAQGLYQLFGQFVTPLHLSICLFLSLTAIVMTWQLRKKIDAATDETREQVYEQIENSPACNNTLAVSSLSTICNFFFLGAAIAYMQPKTILIAAVATLAFLSLNTWVEYTHVDLDKLMNPRFGKADPMSVRFQKDWEQMSDEAEKMGMYRAAWKSFHVTQLALMIGFLICCCVSVFIPLGLAPFLLIAGVWAAHTLSYIFACNQKG